MGVCLNFMHACPFVVVRYPKSLTELPKMGPKNGHTFQMLKKHSSISGLILVSSQPEISGKRMSRFAVRVGVLGKDRKLWMPWSLPTLESIVIPEAQSWADNLTTISSHNFQSSGNSLHSVIPRCKNERCLFLFSDSSPLFLRNG